MARKPKEITDQTYTLLLDAAEVVFSRKGYSETTIHDVAQYAGVTRGAVYWHFQDKYALLQAVLSRTQLPWDRLPVSFVSLEETPSICELARKLSDGLVEITQDPSAHRITLILLHRTELITDNHQVYCRLTEILERIKSYIVAVLQWRFTDAAGTSSAGILAAATSIKALMTGMIFEWMLNQSEVKLDDIQQNFEVLIPSIIQSRLA